MARTERNPEPVGEQTAVDVHVTGQVQGVGFRYATQGAARERGVAGWVRNEPDGSVRAHFEGTAHAVGDLVAWCHVGPAAAYVESVQISQSQVTGLPSFSIET